MNKRDWIGKNVVHQSINMHSFGFFFFLRGGNSLRKNKQISSEETQNAKIHKNFTFQINNVIKEIYFRNMNETH